MGITFYEKTKEIPSSLFNTLASSCFRGFSEKKNAQTHVALRGNISAPVRVTDLVETSKDAASLH